MIKNGLIIPFLLHDCDQYWVTNEIIYLFIYYTGILRMTYSSGINFYELNVA